MSDAFSKDYISTSALAKQLKLPVKNIFQMMSEHGWIARRGQKWVLTSKGEYEGGQYRQSEKYGEYIVWPVDVFQHSMLKSASKHMHITATDLGEPWSIPGRLVYRMLAELGWIYKTVKGWELTPDGKSRHGVQIENEDSGELYCTWPVTLREDPALINMFSKMTVQHDDDDMFAESTSLDGHVCRSFAHKQICDWLYLLNLTHACDRELGDSDLKSDFYLPAHHLYIEYWGAATPHDLADKMSKMAWFEKHNAAVIELGDDEIADLDHVLAKLLLENGVKVY